MIDELIKNLINDRISKLNLTDKMTSHLVKYKKRGTYQALNECTDFEKDIRAQVEVFILEWFKNELFGGNIKKVLLKELNIQLKLELSRKGFEKINITEN